MAEVKTIKNVDERTWGEFKHLAARNKVKLGTFFKSLVHNHERRNNSFWDTILNCERILSDKEAEEMEEIRIASEKPRGEGWKQDPDTLDTWFSSSLWTFSTLGWPDDTKEFKTFHPAAVMETGYDILFFWVARMILMSTALLGQIPFKTVYLHGLVRDPEKKKMSKSKGNVIDPLDVSSKYGTDALRFALVFANAGGTDMAFMEERVKGMKHFGNKVWNIARFIISNTLETDQGLNAKSDDTMIPITDADRDILGKLDETIKLVTKNIEDFRFNEGAQNIYDFIWHELADKYLEASKPQLADADQAENTKLILLSTLKHSLRLLHPFMPFITEYIWELLGTNSFLATEKWPVAK